MDGKVDRIATVAGGKVDADGNSDNAYLAARDLFSKMKVRLERQLEIHRFTFTVPAPAVEALPSARMLPFQKNEGGKPLARHWDEMWAEIAVRLWTGDLQPQTQADVKRAMLEWLNANNIDAGESTVVPRARQLWQKIEAAK